MSKQGYVLPGCGLYRITFPLRPDFTALLTLPQDLTRAEAERLAAFLETVMAPLCKVATK